ncbi:DUF4345 domain-containing protein [Epibacterium ulvae]|uniref:DUF4345 domain-containing protein n=1 Tax=Epibacterium ulvae TaxID=1156985 RepID=UPI001BFC1AC5|nr:DUF4345 domain-containing protein [Epibacterium ulvae]MBT8154856.1 DUF4345 domain-containing protein [Epibacterium ulvae]
MPKLENIFLIVSAAVLVAVGSALSFAPDVLYHGSGAGLPDMTLLRSDLRSGGALLLLIGLYAFWSALFAQELRPALGLSALTYLGYGLGRLVSIGFDGPATGTLLTIIVLEWILGLIALVFAMRCGAVQLNHQATVA